MSSTRAFPLLAAVCLLCAGHAVPQEPAGSMAPPAGAAAAAADTTTATHPIDTTAILTDTVAAPRSAAAPALVRTCDRKVPRQAIFVPIGANTVRDVLAAQPGVAELDGRLYLRGGPAEEVAYFVDGVPATDPYSGALAVALPPSLIEEVALTSGGLAARYGGAMSGMVAIRTFRPGDRTGGRVQWTSDLLTGSRDDHRWDAAVSGPFPHLRGATFALSAQVHNGSDIRPCFMPGTFYVRDAGNDVRGYWADTNRMTGAVWDTITHRYSGSWMDSSDVVWGAEMERRTEYYTRHGWKQTDRPYLPNSGFNDYYLNGGLGYALPSWYGTLQLSAMAGRRQHREYDAQWKYNLDGYGAVLDRSSLISASWQASPAPALRGLLRFSRLNSHHQRGVRDTVAESGRGWWQDYEFIDDDAVSLRPAAYAGADNPYGYNSNNSLLFYRVGAYPYLDRQRTAASDWHGEVTVSWRGHDIEAGADRRATDATGATGFLQPTWGPMFTVSDLGLHDARTAFYLQDRWVFGDWSLMPGVRLDRGTFSGTIGQRWPGYPSFASSDSSFTARASTVSPRLAAAYRLSDGTSVEAGYEHLCALPTMENLSSWLLSAWRQGLPLMADSLFVFQRTVQYHASLRHRLPMDVDASLTVFQRTIDPVVGWQTIIDTLSGIDYLVYGRRSYGRSHGIELTATRRTAALTAHLGYTLCTAVNTAGTDNVPQIHDLRHAFDQTVECAAPASFGPAIGGVRPLAGTVVRLRNRFASGFPYSRLDSHGRLAGPYLSKRLPWVWTTDLAVTREIPWRALTFTIGAEVTNLFDRKNAAGVFGTTGKAENDGGLMSIDEAFPSADSIARYYVDSIASGPDSGRVLYTPNEYYSPYADLNGSGAIDRYEKYAAYRAAWEDLATDPFNAARQPSERAYLQPRLIKLSFGIQF